MNNEKNSLHIIFSKRLKELRSLKYTQKELAEEIGVSRVTIENYESKTGNALPNAEALCALAKALNTTTDYLLGLTTSSKKVMKEREACDYTGLESEAMEKLKMISKKYPDTINSILTSKAFLSILKQLEDTVIYGGMMDMYVKDFGEESIIFCDKMNALRYDLSVFKASHELGNLQDELLSGEGINIENIEYYRELITKQSTKEGE